MTAHELGLARRLANTGIVHMHGRFERAVPFMPRRVIAELQRARLRRIVVRAYEKVPFYRRVMNERGLLPRDFEHPDDFARLPLIDAATVQLNLDDFVATDFRDDRLRTTYHTSGSESGVRRTIYWDGIASVRAFAYLERVWPIVMKLSGATPGRMVLHDVLGEMGAIFVLDKLGRAERHNTLSINFEIPSSASLSSLWSKQTVHQQPQGRLHKVSPLEPFDVAIERMNELQPRIVLSFGSYADQFFRYLEEAGPQVATPRVWVYTGDTPTPTGVDLALARGCRLFSSYNATEVGRIGFHCERCEDHHLNIDLCAVRIVDDEGRTLPSGRLGEVVVSTLRNRALVLLNYRLGDRAMLAPDPCPCGRALPLLRDLQGRFSEILELADGRTISPLHLEGLFRHELRSALKVQIVQLRAGDFVWRIVPFRDADREALVRAVLERARRELGTENSVRVEFVDDIVGTGSGKFRKFAPREAGRERA